MGDGSILRFGEDPWADTTHKNLLPGHKVEALRQRDIIYLYQLATPIHENLWFQSWRSTSSFGLTDIDEGELAQYIGDLNRALIQLRDRKDELVWDVDPLGRYTPKVDYLKLSANGLQRERVWWWKKLWKINSPPKTRLFMWCALKNNVPTWENF